MWWLYACAHTAPLTTMPGDRSGTIAPEVEAMVADMRRYAGDPYAIPGLHFEFVVGDVRREHYWDVPHDRIAVRYTREDGVECTVTTSIPYDGPIAEQRTAWEMFVNDQFWLLAPPR